LVSSTLLLLQIATHPSFTQHLQQSGVDTERKGLCLAADLQQVLKAASTFSQVLKPDIQPSGLHFPPVRQAAVYLSQASLPAIGINQLKGLVKFPESEAKQPMVDDLDSCLAIAEKTQAGLFFMELCLSFLFEFCLSLKSLLSFSFLQC
jgi:hypothetical protein